MKTRKRGVGYKRIAAAFTAGLVSVSMLGFTVTALAAPMDPDSQSPAATTVMTEGEAESTALGTPIDPGTGTSSVLPEESPIEGGGKTANSLVSTASQSKSGETDQVSEEPEAEVQAEESQRTEVMEEDQQSDTEEIQQPMLARAAPNDNYCTTPGTYALESSTSAATRSVRNFPASGAIGAVTGTFTVNAASNPLNALAITPDGNYAYAVERNVTAGNDVPAQSYRIHRLAANSNQGEVLYTTSQYVASGGSSSSTNAGYYTEAAFGAVDPTGTYYYFGRLYRPTSGTPQLQLFAYNLATNTYIGQVGSVSMAGQTAIRGTDGDIAFDSAGNLFIFWASGTAAVSRMYVVNKADLPTTAIMAVITSTSLAQNFASTNNSPWSGLAFDDTGAMFLQRSVGTNSYRVQVTNPAAGTVGAESTITGFAANDLASCWNSVPYRTQDFPVNPGTAGAGPIPTVTSTWTPEGTTNSGATRTFTVKYTNPSTTTAITNARLWHQYMVAHDHQTTYSVTCARTGTATCPTAGTNGMPPTSGLVLNGEADAYYNTFWAIVNLPANSSLTFTITVTSTLADTDDACAADPTVMVDGWARFSQTGFVVPTNVQASASSAGRIRATQCPNGVVTMTNTVTSPGPAANPGRVLSGDARVFTVTWENTGGSTVALPIWYSYLVPHQGNSTEASWTCTSTGGGGASCPTSFPSAGTVSFFSDGTETATTVFGSDPNDNATFATLAAGQKLTFVVTLTTTLNNCTQDGFYHVQTYAKRGIVAGDPTLVRTVAPSQLVEIGCSTWMVDESFAGTSVSDSAWRSPQSPSGSGRACLTESSTVTSAPVLGSCGSYTTGVPTPSFTPAAGQAPGFLQFTDDRNDQVGAVLYDRAIPTKNGLVVEFTQYQFGDSSLNADGIGFFLTDGAYTLSQAGAGGGALGYANKPIQSGYPSGISGLAYGYLGVGFDVFGNFAATSGDIATQCGTSTGTRVPNAVTLRGPGNGMQGYCAIGSTQTLAGVNSSYTMRAQRNGTTNSNLQTVLTASKRKTRIIVYAIKTGETAPRVTVEMDFGDGYYVMVLDRMMTAPAPELIKFGFLGSTGGSRDAHLLGDVRVGTMLPMTALNLQKSVDRRETGGTQKTTFNVGDTIPYQFVVNNTGGGTVYQLQVIDPQIPTVTCPQTQIGAGGQIICTGTYIVTAADRNAGHFLNTATARAATSEASDAPLNLSSVESEDVPINPTANSAARVILPNMTGNPTSATFQILDNGTVDGLVEPDDPTKVEIRLVNQLGQPTDDKTITVSGQGTWTLDATNKVTFTPIVGYAGTVTPLKYEARSKVSVEGVAGSAQGTLSVTLSVAPLRVCTADQQRASGRYWAFGTKAKLDFGISGTTSPTPGTMDAVAATAQGTFTVTDARGNLQFVVDTGSGRILDKDGAVMTRGGTGANSVDPILIPTGTGASPATVFPAGQGTGKYVVVTSSATATVPGQLTYRIIDMSLNGGKGGLSGAEINLGPATASTAVTSVPNADGTGYWVINPLRGIARVNAYQFDATGPKGAVVASDVGVGSGVLPTYTGYDDIRFSKDLTQVATVASNTSATGTSRTRVRLLSFNANTGQLTLIGTTRAAGVADSLGYSVDFSGDGSTLYMSSVAVATSGLNYTVQRATASSTALSAFTSVGSAQSDGGAIRRGADDRLYWAWNSQASLRYLDNPNGTGTTWSSLSLASGTTSGLALSNTLSDCGIPARGFFVEKYGHDNTLVDGAEFKLFPNDPATNHAAADPVSPGFQATGTTGQFLIFGLSAGIYWLRETKAPPGYNLLAKDVRVNVAVDGTVTTPASPPTPQVKLVKNADGTFTFEVTDTRAVALPLAGGQGGGLLLIGGGVALLAALFGALWWHRRALRSIGADPLQHEETSRKGPRHAQARSRWTPLPLRLLFLWREGRGGRHSLDSDSKERRSTT